MISYRLLLAWLLLASPQPIEADDQASLHAEVAPTLRELAIGMEILDRRELGHILGKPETFTEDVKLLRGRYRDLATTPRLAECGRFPPRAIVNDLLAFNRSVKKNLESRMPLDPVHAEDLRVVLDENEQLFNIWDAVREAGCEAYYISVRRHALARLRSLLGPEAFYAGNLPPNVPTWRIPEN